MAEVVIVMKRKEEELREDEDFYEEELQSQAASSNGSCRCWSWFEGESHTLVSTMPPKGGGLTSSHTRSQRARLT